MSIAKMIEISAQSPQGFDDAVRRGIEEAARSVRGMRGAWVKDQSIVLEDGRITMYRVDMKVTFVVD